MVVQRHVLAAPVARHGLAVSVLIRVLVAVVVCAVLRIAVGVQSITHLHFYSHITSSG
jgi:hypothetical protein